MSIERIKKQLEGFDLLKVNLDSLGRIANVPETYAEVMASLKKQNPLVDQLVWIFPDGTFEYLDEQGYNKKVRQPLLDGVYDYLRYTATTPFYNVHEQVQLECMVLDLQKAVEEKMEQKGAIHLVILKNRAFQKRLDQVLAKKPGFFATTAKRLGYVKSLLSLMHRAMQGGAYEENENVVTEYNTLCDNLQEIIKDQQLFITAKNKAAFTLDKKVKQDEGEANKALGSDEYEGVELGSLRNTWTARLVRPFLARMMRFWDHPSMQTVGRFSVLNTLVLPFFEYLHGIESYLRFALPSWFKGVIHGRFSSATIVATFVYATLHAFIPRIDYLTQSVFSSRDPLFNHHAKDLAALYIKEDLTWKELGERLLNRFVGSFDIFDEKAINEQCLLEADRKFGQSASKAHKQAWAKKEAKRYRMHSMVLSMLGAGLNDIVISLVFIWVLSLFMQVDWYMNLLQLVVATVAVRLYENVSWPMFVGDIFLLALAVILPIAIVASWPFITPTMLWQALPWVVGSMLVPDVALTLGHMVSGVMAGAKRLFGKQFETTVPTSNANSEESVNLGNGHRAAAQDEQQPAPSSTAAVTSDKREGPSVLDID